MRRGAWVVYACMWLTIVQLWLPASWYTFSRPIPTCATEDGAAAGQTYPCQYGPSPAYGGSMLLYVDTDRCATAPIPTGWICFDVRTWGKPA